MKKRHGTFYFKKLFLRKGEKKRKRHFHPDGSSHAEVWRNDDFLAAPPLPSCSTPSPRECVNNRTPLTVAHGKKEKRKFKNRSIADALGRTFKYTCERWGSPREFSSFIKSAEPFTNNRRLFAERHFIKRSSLFLQKRIEFIQIRRDAVVLLAASPGN